MKKTLLAIVLAALCLNFSNNAQAQVQPETNKAIDITTKGVQIGQKIPDIPNLSKYKGKFIILDFWATWCSPCITMIPKLEEFQQQFKDQLQIISVSEEANSIVTSFLDRLLKGKVRTVSYLNENSELKKLFPHLYLPHYVWIDDNGKVINITDHHQVTAENIRKVLSGQTVLKKKVDTFIELDRKRPLLIGGNGGNGSSLIYHSIMTGHIPGLSGAWDVFRDSAGAVNRFLMTNQPILSLFRMAYQGDKLITRNEIINKVAVPNVITTSVKGDSLARWYEKNVYCYDIAAPRGQTAKIFKMMQADLARCFPQYSASVDTLPTKCLVLVRTSKEDKLKSKGGKSDMYFSVLGCKLSNAFFQHFMHKLRLTYLQKSKLPIIDESGIDYQVDFEINANLSDVSSINDALKSYDLKLIEAVRPVRMFTICDSAVSQKGGMQ